MIMKIFKILLSILFVSLAWSCATEKTEDIKPINAKQEFYDNITLHIEDKTEYPTQQDNYIDAENLEISKYLFNFYLKNNDKIIDENDESINVFWEFGDFSNITNNNSKKNPTHEYVEPGVYNVRVKVEKISDNDSLRNTVIFKEVSVIAGKEKDILNSQILATRGGIDDLRYYNFIASATSTLDQSLKYSWNFGDGSPITGVSLNNNINHFFPKFNQEYKVKLSVDNGIGNKIVTELDLVTDKPKLEISCYPGGVTYVGVDNDRKAKQNLNCKPITKGGNIEDIKYRWIFYSLAADLNGNNECLDPTHIKKSYTELDLSNSENKGKYKTLWGCFKKEGENESELNNEIFYTFNEGGHKYVEVLGRSERLIGYGKKKEDGKIDLNNNTIKTEKATYLPSNVVIKKPECKKSKDDASGLTYQCISETGAIKESKAELDNNLNAINNRTSAISNTQVTQIQIPLKSYSWKINDEIIPFNGDSNSPNISVLCGKTSGNKVCDINSIDKCDRIKIKTTKDGNGVELDRTNSSGNMPENSDQFLENKKYDKCFTSVTFKSKKYDINDYSSAILDVEYYDEIKNDAVSKYSVQRDFEVKAPQVDSFSFEKVGNSNYTYKFDLKFENGFDLSNANVTYVWNFGDGTSKTSNISTINHTYNKLKSEYDVSVYAESPLFGKTNEYRRNIGIGIKLDENCELNVKADSNDNNDNMYTFSYNNCKIKIKEGNGDYKDIPTNLSLRVFGGSFDKTINLNSSGSSIKSFPATKDNVNNKNTLSIPYGMPLSATLNISSDLIESTFSKTEIIPVQELNIIEFQHPYLGRIGASDYNKIYLFYLSNLAGDTGHKASPEKLTCIYDLNPSGINNEYIDGLHISTQNSKPSNNSFVTRIEAPCNSEHYLNYYGKKHNIEVNGNKYAYIKILAKIVGSPLHPDFYRERFLDVYIKKTE